MPIQHLCVYSYNDTVCTTQTGCDRFTGVCDASLIVEATLGVAITLLVIGAMFSEHTKIFAVTQVLAGLLGMAAMSAWVNWQMVDGNSFSAEDVQLGTGGWLIVGGWLLLSAAVGRLSTPAAVGCCPLPPAAVLSLMELGSPDTGTPAARNGP